MIIASSPDLQGLLFFYLAVASEQGETWAAAVVASRQAAADRQAKIRLSSAAD